MTFEIELNGRTRTVSIERSAEGRFRVTIDGTVTTVDARRVGDFGVSLLFPGDTHAVTAIDLAPGASPGEVLAHLGGRTIAIVVNGRRTSRGGADAGSAHGEHKIVAPMPGRVVRVLVACGDEVAARQPVIVIEAMKMENELRSAKAGRVKHVEVGAGASVEAGRVLLVVE